MSLRKFEFSWWLLKLKLIPYSCGQTMEVFLTHSSKNQSTHHWLQRRNGHSEWSLIFWEEALTCLEVLGDKDRVKIPDNNDFKNKRTTDTYRHIAVVTIWTLSSCHSDTLLSPKIKVWWKRPTACRIPSNSLTLSSGQLEISYWFVNSVNAVHWSPY